jgi:hypothetical protein
MSTLALPSKLSWGIDCPSSQIRFVPRDVPAIWPYVTGTTDVRWTDTEIAGFTRSHVFRVNQHFDNDDPFTGDEFDIEELAWTPEEIIPVVQARRARHWSTRLYGTYATYDATVLELVKAGVRTSTFWRIADWNLDQHLAAGSLWADVYAGQWASPGSNPETLIPGTSDTLDVANADLNVLLIENTGWAG